MKCPNCGTEFQPDRHDLAHELGKCKSPKKAEAARANGRKGGRPRSTNKRPAGLRAKTINIKRLAKLLMGGI